MRRQRVILNAGAGSILGLAVLLLSTPTPALAQTTAEELYQAGL